MNSTEPLARSAATDAGNRSMRTAGRVSWNADDYAEACRVFASLWSGPETRLIHGINPALAELAARKEAAIRGRR